MEGRGALAPRGGRENRPATVPAGEGGPRKEGTEEGRGLCLPARPGEAISDCFCGPQGEEVHRGAWGPGPYLEPTIPMSNELLRNKWEP